MCYGQTSAPVAYNDTPKYRAFRFEGVAGDAVSIWVRSKNGDARAWLVDAAFLNVAMNNDADATTKDAHVVTTLPATGTYYVAFREVSQEDATFVVSLDKTNTPTQPPACDPEEENCTPGGGTTGRVVDGDDRSLSGYFQANEVVESWGKGLWDGYASMTAYNDGYGRVYLIDGSGQNYDLGKSTQTKFDRLPLPIQLVSSDSASIGVQLTGMKYEVTGTHAIAPPSLRGKFEGTYQPATSQSRAFEAGDTLTASATGGDVAPFADQSVSAPSDLVVSAPAFDAQSRTSKCRPRPSRSSRRRTAPASTDPSASLLRRRRRSRPVRTPRRSVSRRPERSECSPPRSEVSSPA